MSSPSSPDEARTLPGGPLAIHLDLIGGLAGDMFVAAVVDALPALIAPIMADLAAVRPAGAAGAAFAFATTGGLRARRFGLDGPASTAAPQRRTRVPRAGRAHGPPTGYAALRRELHHAALAPATREHALALLALLGQAEADVHGVPIDDVHFHELADWDSRMDLVAAGCIAGHLAGAQWTASALPLGGGTVATAHGILPVPAPATARLLVGYPWHDDGVRGERVTPTGAAILRHLVMPAQCGGQRPGGRLLGVGCGAGTRTLAGIPNMVRATVMEAGPASDHEDAFAAPLDQDRVTIVAFDVDDMTGEEIAAAADMLRGEAGILDLSVGSRQGKKGRLVADFRLLVRPESILAIAHACFAETSTLGLRVHDEQRYLVPRSETTEHVDGLAVGVKSAVRPYGVQTAKAEHDHVLPLRGLRRRRAVRTAAVAQSRKRRSP